MKAVSLYALLACILAVGASFDEASQQAAGKVKLEKMLRKEASSSGGLISLTALEYNELIQQNPRPYDVVLLWNVPPGRCDHCQIVSSEFNQVIYSFNADRGTEKVQNKHIFFV